MSEIQFSALRRDRRRTKKPSAAKNGAVVYCRVSTKEQADNFSLPVQERTCRDYCNRNAWEVLKVFKEAESAKTVDRPEFQAMMQYCVENQKRIAAVVFYDTTRFSRETSDYLAFKAILQSRGCPGRS